MAASSPSIEGITLSDHLGSTQNFSSTSSTWHSQEHQEVLRRDAALTYKSRYPSPIAFDRGKGCELWDVDGKRYLDFESGQFTMNVGHSHPDVTQAILEQSSKLMQIGNRFTNPVRVRLAEKLAEITPAGLDTSLFCSTGSEANELALSLAKLVTGRAEVVAVARGYHGRTSSAFSLSSSSRRMRKGYGLNAPGMFLVPPSHAYRCPFECGSCDRRCWSQATEMIDRATSGEPAAVIMEFVLGAGGVIPVDPAWAQEIRAFCDERGALLVADESLTGLGRTGRWFAFEHAGVTPDIIVVSKALGGGVPMAAVIVTPAIREEAFERGYLHGSSHLGDPFQSAVALANIDIIQKQALLENATAMGEVIRQRLHKFVGRFDLAGDARGIGLIQGLEIVLNEEECPAAASAVTVECMRRGLIVGGMRPGLGGANVLRLAPPLCVTPDEVAEGLEIVESALEAVSESGSWS
ncbi:MAG: aspartate aminotransferase family protein [Acidimicrobiia bacterium]